MSSRKSTFKINKNPRVKVDKNMPDYSQCEFFLKKEKAARELLEKYPFPGELLKRK